MNILLFVKDCLEERILRLQMEKNFILRKIIGNLETFWK